MNPLSSKNPLQSRPGENAAVGDYDFSVSYSDTAFCELDAWFDKKMDALEARFEKYVTGQSQRRSFGR